MDRKKTTHKIVEKTEKKNFRPLSRQVFPTNHLRCEEKLNGTAAGENSQFAIYANQFNRHSGKPVHHHPSPALQFEKASDIIPDSVTNFD